MATPQPLRKRLSLVPLVGLVAMAAATSTAPLHAGEPKDADLLAQLRVGHWVEVRGRLGADGVFVAERIEARRPRSTSRLWGVATPGEEAGSLVVLGRTLDVGRDTEWRGTDAGRAPGKRLRVQGHVGPGDRFVATRIERRDPGVERISGRIDHLEPLPAGGVVVRILGYEVRVPEDTRQRQEVPLAELELTPVRPMVTHRGQLSDLDDYLGAGFVLSPQLQLGLRQDLVASDQRDTRLDGDGGERAEEDTDDASHSVRARLVWTPNRRASALVDARLRSRYREDGTSGARTETTAILNEAYFLVRGAFLGIDLSVGRQDFDEPREWLFDQNLDAVRLGRRVGGFDVDLSLSATLDGGSQRDRDALNTILYVSRGFDRRVVAAYVVDRDFGSRRDERQTHAGLRFFGPVAGPLSGWLELAHLTGHRDGRSIDAWGGDLGVQLRGRGRARWTATAALAKGGGDSGGGVDHRFRQTGLQDNYGPLGGLTEVLYYGELVDPELSNLEIATLGLGRRLTRRTSLELIAHRYRQEIASRRLTNTDLDRRPDGVNRDLGWELDVVAAYRRSHWEVELVGARFEPGEAFPAGEAASLAKIGIRYRY